MSLGMSYLCLSKHWEGKRTIKPTPTRPFQEWRASKQALTHAHLKPRDQLNVLAILLFILASWGLVGSVGWVSIKPRGSRKRVGCKTARAFRNSNPAFKRLYSMVQGSKHWLKAGDNGAVWARAHTAAHSSELLLSHPTLTPSLQSLD